MADLKEYWQELAKKHSIPQERVAAILEALGDATVSRAISDGFVPRPEYSRDLDKTRDEWKGKVDKYEKWYEEEAKPAFAANKAGVDRLQKYVEMYGELPDGTKVPDKIVAGITKKELEEMFAQRDAAYVNLTKAMTKAQGDHYHRFKEPLDTDGLEKFALERQLPLDQAYGLFIQPKLDTLKNEEFEKRITAAKEEAVRDYASKHRLPVQPARSEFSPVFDQKPVKAGTSDMELEQTSKEAFLAGWYEANAEPVNR